ncbi:MAG: hypothetical protein KF884_11990 [Fimbriimonadaceae bacterium]|nr:hypothetical protein [Fimbriimonadaceae bacterium]QYK58263.1 MAG: hypothetical protein KF884_11990 [Fimbriimonadaceae bacterium]
MNPHADLNKAGWSDPEFSLTPFWFWNGDLEPRELLRQVDEMLEKGVRAFVIHARTGLNLPYLGEEWFERVGLVVERASQLGMHVWIYDEDNWPSGYAGGAVLGRDPRLTPQCLECERVWLDDGQDMDWPPQGVNDPRGRGQVVTANAVRVKSVRPRPADPLAWHGPHVGEPKPWWDRGGNEIELDSKVQRLGLAPGDTLRGQLGNEGRWLVALFRQRTTEWYPAYTDEYYVDVLHPQTAKVFIETTHEQYYRRFGQHFGKTIRGFFVDEPGLYNNFWDRNPGSVPWTDDFAEFFVSKMGRDPRDSLILLYEDIEGHEEFRFLYYDFVAQIFDERFMQPIADWCELHGVLLTGHLMLEEFMVPMARYAGNPFRALKSLHIPGVDRIDEVYEKTAERIASSVAHLAGRDRCLSETYACIGWKLAPPYMKAILDYQLARGVNMVAPHAFYYSIEGFRAHESPPSEFFQNPWWEDFKPFAEYAACASQSMSEGRPKKDFLVYYPIESVTALITPDWPPGRDSGPTEWWQLPHAWHPAVRIDREFVNLVVQLEQDGFDFDLIDHSFLAMASVEEAEEGACLVCGHVTVDRLVVPFVHWLAPSTLEKIQEFQEAGGQVITFDSPAIPLNQRTVEVASGALGALSLALGARDEVLSTELVPSVRDPQRAERDTRGLPARCSRTTEAGETVHLGAKPFAAPGIGPPGGPQSSSKEVALDWTVEGRPSNDPVTETAQSGPHATVRTYEAKFDWPFPGQRARLTAYGRETMRTALNGVDLGPRAFPPYVWELGEPLPSGNQLKVRVTGTLTWQIEGRFRAFGLTSTVLEAV